MVVVVVVVYLSICLSASLKTKQFCKASSMFEGVTTSKTQQFCATSSSFELDNIKIETILRDFLNFRAILRDFLQECKVDCKAAGLVPMRFAICPLHLSKVLLRLPRKNAARLYEVLHLSRKIILANLKIRCWKMQPLS